MRLSVKSDYAARAILELARHYDFRGICRVEDLATKQGIPANYLVQILLELKAKGLVRSVRGKEGGYLLARPPGEITLGTVLRAMHGSVFESPAQNDPQCPAELRAVWVALQRTLDAAADEVTFLQLVEDGTDRGKMYYI